jgi:hypothetical protein
LQIIYRVGKLIYDKSKKGGTDPACSYNNAGLFSHASWAIKSITKIRKASLFSHASWAIKSINKIRK